MPSSFLVLPRPRSLDAPLLALDSALTKLTQQLLSFPHLQSSIESQSKQTSLTPPNSTLTKSARVTPFLPALTKKGGEGVPQL